MRKKLLTLSDLYDFYVKQNKNVNFSSSNEDSEIIVQVDGNINFEAVDKNDGLLPVILQACHTETNLNNSRISEEVMTTALPSFANRPILGFIHEIDGQPEFYSHNMHETENGELIYDEYPIGVIPESCQARLEYDKEKEKTYVIVNGYIYKEYSKAADILMREGQCSVSVELSVNQLSYNADDKVLDIEVFTFSGVTILGKNVNGNIVQPGMVGSNIQIADFSKKNNSLIEQIQLINKRLDSFNIYLKEGGNTEEMSKLDELLEEYGKTIDDIDFDYEGLSDEELEEAFKEAFGDAKEADEDDNIIDYSVNNKKFSVSLNDKIYALQTLVNETYSESDYAYYTVIVYDDELVMVDTWQGYAYRQSYKEDNGIFTLLGDRVAVHAMYVTDEEEKQLNDIKANYSVISRELKQYKDEPEKIKILESDDYSLIFDNEDFIALKEQKNHFNLSVKEVIEKADEILTKVAKNHRFSINKPESKKPMPLPASRNKKKHYGSLFDGIVK